MGFTICPLASVAQAIGKAVASRTRSREGSRVYQTASFSLPAISRQACLELFGVELLQQPSSMPNKSVWVASTVKQVHDLIGPIMIQSGYVCAGATRALKTNSERWSRVVAHIIPQLMVSHLATTNQLLIDFQYVLLDEAGEFHPPKDANRNELRLSHAVMSEARAQIREDLMESLQGSRFVCHQHS